MSYDNSRKEVYTVFTSHNMKDIA